MNTFDKNMEKPLVSLETKSPVDNLDLKQDLVDSYEQTKSNLQDLIDNGKDATPWTANTRITETD